MNLTFEHANKIIRHKPLVDVNLDFSNQTNETLESILKKLEQILHEIKLDNKAKRKGYNISVNLLHNAIRHGSDQSKIYFAMAIDSGIMLFITENYILAHERSKIKDYLDYLNLIERQTFKDLFKLSISLAHQEKKIGFIDIKMKSNYAPLLYHFSEVENGLVLFSLIVTLEIRI